MRMRRCECELSKIKFQLIVNLYNLIINCLYTKPINFKTFFKHMAHITWYAIYPQLIPNTSFKIVEIPNSHKDRKNCSTRQAVSFMTENRRPNQALLNKCADISPLTHVDALFMVKSSQIKKYTYSLLLETITELD